MKWSKKDLILAGLLGLILLTLAGGIAFISYKFKDYDFALGQVARSKQIPGPKGENGITTTQTIVSYLPAKDGRDGKDGVDGQNATDDQVKTAVENYFTQHPTKDGKDGQPGAPGLIVFVHQNILGFWECRYGNDSGWIPLEECSQ